MNSRRRKKEEKKKRVELTLEQVLRNIAPRGIPMNHSANRIISEQTNNQLFRLFKKRKSRIPRKKSKKEKKKNCLDKNALSKSLSDNDSGAGDCVSSFCSENIPSITSSPSLSTTWESFATNWNVEQNEVTSSDEPGEPEGDDVGDTEAISPPATGDGEAEEDGFPPCPPWFNLGGVEGGCTCNCGCFTGDDFPREEDKESPAPPSSGKGTSMIMVRSMVKGIGSP